MLRGEAGAHDGVALGLALLEGRQVDDLHVLHLVDLQESQQLGQGRQLPGVEATLSSLLALIVHLCTVAPEEVLLRPFDKPSLVVSEFGLIFFFLLLGHVLLSVENIVFLTKDKLLIDLFLLLFRQLPVNIILDLAIGVLDRWRLIVVRQQLVLLLP